MALVVKWGAPAMNISLEHTNVTEIYYLKAFIINYTFKTTKNIGEIV